MVKNANSSTWEKLNRWKHWHLGPFMLLSNSEWLLVFLLIQQSPFDTFFERAYVFWIEKVSYSALWNQKRGKKEVISDLSFLLHVTYCCNLLMNPKKGCRTGFVFKTTIGCIPLASYLTSLGLICKVSTKKKSRPYHKLFFLKFSFTSLEHKKIHVYFYKSKWIPLVRVDKKSNVGYYWGRTVAWEAFSSSAGLMLSWKYADGPLFFSPLWCHWFHCRHGSFQSEQLPYSWLPCPQFPAWLLYLSICLPISQNVDSRLRQPCPIPTLPLLICDREFLSLNTPHIPSDVRIQPLSPGLITFPSSSLKTSHLGWAAPYFSKPKLWTTMDLSIMANGSSHSASGNVKWTGKDCGEVVNTCPSKGGSYYSVSADLCKMRIKVQNYRFSNVLEKAEIHIFSGETSRL